MAITPFPPREPTAAVDPTIFPINSLPDDLLIPIFRCITRFRDRESRSFHDEESHTRFPPSCTRRCEPSDRPRLPPPSRFIAHPNPFSHALVCRRWLPLARLALPSIHVRLRRNLWPEKLQRAFSRFPNLRCLRLEKRSIDSVSNAFFQSLADSCPLLECLDVGSVAWEWSNDDFGLPKTAISNNRSGLREAGLAYLFGKCIHLQEIRLLFVQSMRYLPYQLFTLPRLRLLHLDVPHADQLELADLDGDFEPIASCHVSSLEDLELSAGISDLPESFLSLLPGLRRLSLWKVPNLSTLPSYLPRLLNSLTSLTINDSPIAFLPDTINLLTSLSECKLVKCVLLQKLPQTFTLLPRLERLLIQSCASFSTLPSTLGDLASLRCLEISDCLFFRILPDSLTDLSNLTSLEITACPTFQTFPPSYHSQLTALTHLHLSSLPIQSNLPEFLSHLPELKVFHLHHCQELQWRPRALAALSSLQSLHLAVLPRLFSLPQDISLLPSLQILDVSECQHLSSLPPLLPPSLTLLSVSHCDKFSSLPPSISSLTSLHSLSIRHCKRLHQLPPSLTCLSSLTSLRLECCYSLSSVPPGIGKMPRLLQLSLDGCELVDGYGDEMEAWEGAREGGLEPCRKALKPTAAESGRV